MLIYSFSQALSRWLNSFFLSTSIGIGTKFQYILYHAIMVIITGFIKRTDSTYVTWLHLTAIFEINARCCNVIFKHALEIRPMPCSSHLLTTTSFLSKIYIVLWHLFLQALKRVVSFPTFKKFTTRTFNTTHFKNCAIWKKKFKVR